MLHARELGPNQPLSPTQKDTQSSHFAQCLTLVVSLSLQHNSRSLLGHITSEVFALHAHTGFDHQAEQSYTFEATSFKVSEDAASTAASAALPGPNLSATFTGSDPPRSARPAEDANLSNCTRAGQVFVVARLTGLQDASLGARRWSDSTRLCCLCKLARSNAPISCTASTAAGSCSGTTTWKNLSPPVPAASSQSAAATFFQKTRCLAHGRTKEKICTNQCLLTGQGYIQICQKPK